MFQGQMTITFQNRQYEHLTSWEFVYDKESGNYFPRAMDLYVLPIPIGTFTIDFIETDFLEKKQFGEYVSKFGLGGLRPYSKTLNNVFLQIKHLHSEGIPKTDYPSFMTKIYNECWPKLWTLNNKFKKDLAEGLENALSKSINLERNKFSIGFEMGKLNNKPFLKEMFSCDDIRSIIFLELKEAFQNGVLFRQCNNCNRFFLPKRSDQIYCERSYNNDRTCKEIGAMTTYTKTIKASPDKEAYRLYKSKYKTMHSRRYTRSKNSKVKITEERLVTWNTEAREHLRKTENGEMSIAEFKEWLERSVR